MNTTVSVETKKKSGYPSRMPTSPKPVSVGRLCGRKYLFPVSRSNQLAGEWRLTHSTAVLQAAREKRGLKAVLRKVYKHNRARGNPSPLLIGVKL